MPLGSQKIFRPQRELSKHVFGLKSQCGTSAGDPDVRRISYLMIDRTDKFVVIPAAFATLVGGVVLCTLTKWGVTRFWWVLVKLFSPQL